MEISVGIAAHKQYTLPTDSCYLPIEVGAALHPDRNLGYQSDAEGINISDQNDSYSELTAIYWLWKNSTAEYKGLVHYRRYFGKSGIAPKFSTDRYARIATRQDFESSLRTAPVILPVKRNYVIESIESHYSHTLTPEHPQVVREILGDTYPEYLESFEKVMGSTKAHLFNMFVMRSDLFDQYCQWLFPILEEVDRRVDSSNYSPFEKRFLGRISEWLLDVWLDKNNIAFTELPVVSPEPVAWGKKIKGVLAAKFLGKKYEASF